MQKSNLITAAVLVLAVGFGAWATTRPKTAPPAPLPTICAVPDFTLTDQNGHAVKRSDLLGHPFILDFIFTDCTQFCSDMTGTLVKLRAALGADSRVRTVSITVDPSHDRPQVLKRYAAAHHADDPQWLFLTGDRRTIGLVMQGLYLAPPGDPARFSPAQHSPRLLLVDARGQLRGFYAYDDLDARQRIVADARSLDARGDR